jgi:hypothetical protein
MAVENEPPARPAAAHAHNEIDDVRRAGMAFEFNFWNIAD